MFVYFDFDNFKPFNDNYGFRLGDRIILLFADILREHSHSERIFAGHIGGDDFFVGFSGRDLGPKEVQATVRGLIERFSNDVLSFYSPEDVVQGFFVGTDRDGMVRNFPLLSVSAGIVHAARGMVLSSPDQLNELIVDVKKRSKAASSNIAYALVNGNETLDLEFEENQDSVVAG